MKKLLWIGLAVVLVGVILYGNIQQQKTITDKKTVLVILPMTGNAAVWGDLFSKGVEYFKDTHPKSKIDIKLIDSQLMIKTKN